MPNFHKVYQDRLAWYRATHQEDDFETTAVISSAGGALTPRNSFEGSLREGIESVGNGLMARESPWKMSDDQFLAFVDPELCLPEPGIIVSWSYYAQKRGAIELQVYRPCFMSDGVTRATLVGSNFIETKPGLHTEELQHKDQICFEEGDLLGYTFDNRAGTQPVCYGQEGNRVTLSTRNRAARGIVGAAGGAGGGLIFGGPIGLLVGGIGGLVVGENTGKGSRGWLSTPVRIGQEVEFAQSHSRVSSFAANFRPSRLIS